MMLIHSHFVIRVLNALTYTHFCVTHLSPLLTIFPAKQVFPEIHKVVNVNIFYCLSSEEQNNSSKRVAYSEE